MAAQPRPTQNQPSEPGTAQKDVLGKVMETVMNVRRTSLESHPPMGNPVFFDESASPPRHKRRPGLTFFRGITVLPRFRRNDSQSGGRA